MQTHPDKSCKKVVVQIFKSFIIQTSNLKYQTTYPQAIAQLLSLSVANLNKQIDGTLNQGLVLDLQSLPESQKTYFQIGLELSTRSVFLLNPKTLDDQTLIKAFSEIQLALLILGFREPLLAGL